MPGNSAYQLQVHSPSVVYAAQDSNGNNSAEGLFFPSQPMEISFTNGDNFSLSSIALGVHYEGVYMGIPGMPGMPGGGSYGPEQTTVIISGVDANGNTVDSKTVTLTANSGTYDAQFQTITFSGMTNIKTLKIDESSTT